MGRSPSNGALLFRRFCLVRTFSLCFIPSVVIGEITMASAVGNALVRRAKVFNYKLLLAVTLFCKFVCWFFGALCTPKLFVSNAAVQSEPLLFAVCLKRAEVASSAAIFRLLFVLLGWFCN